MRQSLIYIRIILLVSTLAVLSACGTKKIAINDANQDVHSTTEKSPEKLLAIAHTTANLNTRNATLLEAARLYWEQGFTAQAKAITSEIDSRYIRDKDWSDYWLLALDIALIEENRERLRAIIPNLLNGATFKRSIEDQQLSTDKITQALELTDQPLQAALLQITNRGLHSEDSNLSERVWHLLKATDAQTLARYEDKSDNYDIQGWLALAKTIRLNQSRLEEQYQALLGWQADWAFHPAANDLPKELEVLSALPKNRPNNIIVALPFTGPIASVSNAIRDGLLARHYQYQAERESLHSRADSIPAADIIISTYDTNIHAFENLYEQGLDQNTIIIGPLKKETLAKLSLLEHVPIKTLALNYIEEAEQVSNLYQFSLNPEHETTQVAQRIADDGFHRVGMLAPESEWGHRTFDAFGEASREQHNTVVVGAFYGEQSTLSDAVAKMLATDQSKQRARTVRQITGLRLESTPRRRQDIDAVFMIAKASTAKQLKPLLAYHYANDLPVYATSQINNLNDDSNTRDLNGITFVDMPWSLSASVALRHQLENHFPQTATRYSRFYAMGIDVFQLAPRIELLTQVENSHIEGQTGKLSIDHKHTVNRSLQWARFRGGKPTTIK